MNEQLKSLAQAMRAELERIPREMLQEDVARRALIRALAGAVEAMGLLPLMGWKPPRSTREAIDLVGVDAASAPPRVEMAFVVDPLVELPRLKTLEWLDCPHKVVVSFSSRADKVAQTSFFLGPQHIHLKLYD
ncbi:hypothetical protein Deba_1759 [Desulfarculus baarsii DSM 2075]|uniref:Uncharacterized protein n=1 Tax=Desulfarculus baarsii (strain ATCC 33931 / DSM 2075 / LMG 7858 / VKM B-1802 / 2st14) TaxID=644282 RepID=E1QHT3_DESB2|nr:hypothetical protein [Desulfarculus baarsii]ADK85126.1 hypothetical protein Deba_1759 [Desulfarculus baarsii DSM 2075]